MMVLMHKSIKIIQLQSLFLYPIDFTFQSLFWYPIDLESNFDFIHLINLFK